MDASKTSKPVSDRRAAERRVGKAPFDGGDKRAAERRSLADRRGSRRD